MDYKDTYSRRKKFNFLNTGNFQNYLSLAITVPNSLLEEIQKTQKIFLWYFSKPKINHKTLCNTFEDGGLKNVDAKSQIISSQGSWIKSYMTVTIMTGKLYHYIL